MPVTTLTRQPLPYFDDSAQLFSAHARKPWAILLDSTYPISGQGRFDIMAYDPECTLECCGSQTTITTESGSIVSGEDPFLLVKRYLGEARPAIEGLPFNGGAMGYFAYDLARRVEKLPVIAESAEQLPDMAVGIYRWAVIVDHILQQSWLVGYDLDPDLITRLSAQFSHLPRAESAAEFRVLQSPRANMSREHYAEAFARVKHYLKEGDCYQINLTQRFVSPCQGDPWTAYQALRHINAAPFSAYLNLPDVQVLSSSPERFLKLTNGHIETKPIKGTRPRKNDPELDRQQMSVLANSEKDRAENVMIVDLLRNDIGKCSQKGTVTVPELFAIESYATVHHLVSTVRGELAEDRHALDLLRSCFPGGSITGAPKVRAMEIIEELEPHRRGIYCGAIGYIGYDGNMDSNIVIRTLVHNQGNIRFWVGGGIVNDSDEAEEYQECFDKAAALLKLLQFFQEHADSH